MSNNNDLIIMSANGRLMNPLQIGKTTVVLERHLAEGGFARVYQGHLQQSPDYKVAVKHIHTSPEPSSYEPVLGEIELMKTFHHKNIVQLIDSSVQRKQEGGYEIFICMEFCAGGQVVDLMNRRLTQNRRFTEAEVLKIFSDVVEAVAHLHYQQPPVVHRDLKVENVLLHSNGTFKLCDFGSCTRRIVPTGTALRPNDIAQIQDDLDRNTTLQYRAPEMCDLYKRRGLTEKVDIWALGVLLYKLCFFTTPFESEGSKLAILNGRYQIPPNSYFSSRMIQLIRFLLTDHPAARPDVYQTLSYVCEMRGVPCPIQNIYLGVQEAPPELPPKDFPRERKRQMLAINDDLSGILLTANHQSQQSAQSGMRRGRHGRGGGGDPNTVDAAANRQPSNLISSNHPSKQLNDLFGIPASDTHTIEYGVSVDKPQIDSKPKQAIDEIFGFLDSKSMPTAESFARSNVFDNDIQFNPLSDNPHAAVASPDLFGSTEPRQKPESRRPSIHAAAKQNSPLGDPQGLQFGSNVKNNDPFDFTTIVSSASRPKTPMLTVSPMPSNFLLPAAPTSANAISAVQELNDIFGASGINVGGGNPSPKTAAASGGSYWDSQ